MTLLAKVERHLRHSAQSPSRFGRDVIGDPRFVFDLRRGREPRAATAARVLAAIAGGSPATSSKSLLYQETSGTVAEIDGSGDPAGSRPAVAIDSSEAESARRRGPPPAGSRGRVEPR